MAGSEAGAAVPTFASEYERELAAIRERSLAAQRELKASRAAASVPAAASAVSNKAKKRQAKKEAKLAEQRRKKDAKRQRQAGDAEPTHPVPSATAPVVQAGQERSSGEADLRTPSPPQPMPSGSSGQRGGGGGAGSGQHRPKKTHERVLSPGGCGGVELLTPPKRKGGPRAMKSPLPVAVSASGGASASRKCRGMFTGFCVWVIDGGDMQTIYSQGCFGKGILSKSIPEKLAKNKKQQGKKDKRKERDPKGKNDRKRKRDATDSDTPQVERSKTLRMGEAGAAESVSVGVDLPDRTQQAPGTGALPEYLQLSLVEAFFLTYSLGVLTVFTEEGEEMSRLACWQEFKKVESCFAENYAVYHYLRGRGWVPKSGLKFGVEFLAYRKGPQYYHSSYSILVRTVDAETLEPLQGDGYNRRVVTWATMANLTRLTAQVGKELVICYVLVPSTMRQDDWATPLCLEKLAVQHTLLRRWIPEKTRYGGGTTTSGGGS